MSGRAETEMQIQIMTKETPFANRKLLLEEITNNERNEMEEEQMEEIEIKEGHDDVEEEQGNKFREVQIWRQLSCWRPSVDYLTGRYFPFQQRPINIDLEELLNILLCLGRTEMEDWPLQEKKSQEGQEKFRVGRSRRSRRKQFWKPMESKRLKGDSSVLQFHCRQSEESVDIDLIDQLCFWRKVMEAGPFEEYKSKEGQETFRGVQSRLEQFFQEVQIWRQLSERRTMTKLDEILENWLKTEGKSTDAVDFLKNYQPLPPKEAMSKKKRNMKHHGMLPMSVQTNAVVEDDAIMEREKLTDVTEELSGEFDDEEKEKRELEQLLRCKVCLDSDACVVLFPCRHMATCEYCEGFIQCCPVCRSFIDEAVKVNEEN